MTYDNLTRISLAQTLASCFAVKKKPSRFCYHFSFSSRQQISCSIRFNSDVKLSLSLSLSVHCILKHRSRRGVNSTSCFCKSNQFTAKTGVSHRSAADSCVCLCVFVCEKHTHTKPSTESDL